MKSDKIKNKIQKSLNELRKYLETDDNNKPSLHKKHNFNTFKKDTNDEKEELITGIVVVAVILIILFSTCYYFLVFSPQMQQLQEHKTEKTNQLNSIFKDDLANEATRQALQSRIDSASNIEEVEQIDVESAAYPVIKNKLLTEIEEMKDKYKRVDVVINNASTIMSLDNATKFIETAPIDELANTEIRKVDTVIVPVTINRKQAASGLISENDIVDIYTTQSMMKTETNENTTTNDTNTTEDNTTTVDENNNTTTKIAGGSQVISILRSKDAGEIDSNYEVNKNNTNNTTKSEDINVNIEEVLKSKSAGVYDEKEYNLLLEKYGMRLANYERTSNIGDLECQYIIMLEVPRDSVDMILSNMDNIILTIPTYNAPDWVKIKQ
ncbi:DUF515 domain-containing protein [Methanosphaera cuniculi]|uniref:Flp pilus assembly protein RcpC/CpaB domain-containing protein n=1 Tax=Methanosphaera cuniculi TaxID=1077256 RepID=A0A2A2HCS3_9EURY|nr:DUF515 domain-containing protein [Methanosphaera cuniculi]PAV07120.1 hypothetical protein ASJ82_05405 [Methanosphaera cuniculi]PWL09047.1 hypothetical protein MSCUN_00150 [Methanosphaera cuniculi]